MSFLKALFGKSNKKNEEPSVNTNDSPATKSIPDLKSELSVLYNDDGSIPGQFLKQGKMLHIAKQLVEAGDNDPALLVGEISLLMAKSRMATDIGRRTGDYSPDIKKRVEEDVNQGLVALSQYAADNETVATVTKVETGLKSLLDEIK